MARSSTNSSTPTGSPPKPSAKGDLRTDGKADGKGRPGAADATTVADDELPDYHPERYGLPGIVGQPAVTRALTEALRHGRPAHAYLFDGPDGVGKATCARALFAALNCQQRPLDATAAPPALFSDVPPAPVGSPLPVGAACGICDSCQKIATGNHPDLIPFDMSLSGLADEVEKLIRRLQFPPFEGRAQMVVFDPADHFAMPTATTAANRLLKTLEEPRPNTHLVLISTAASSLLSTLRSRCQRLRFTPLSDGDMQTVLDAAGWSQALDSVAEHAPPDGSAPPADAVDPASILKLAQGSPGAARRALSDRQRIARNTEAMRSLYNAARSGRATAMVGAASDAGADREQAQEIVELLWLRLHDELRAAVHAHAPVRTRERLISALRAARAAQQAIRGYTAAPLALERMLRHVSTALQPNATPNP